MCTPPKTPVVVEAPKDAVERRVTPPLSPRSRVRVTRGEETRMPTAHGDFDAVCYTETNSGLEHLVLTKGDVSAAQAPLARATASARRATSSEAVDVIVASNCKSRSS